MNNPVVIRMLGILTERFRERGLRFVLAEELNIKDPVTERGLTDEEKDYVKKTLLTLIQYKVSDDGLTLAPVSVVADPRMQEKWYEEWLDRNNNTLDSFHWRRLEDFLSRELTEKYGHQRA